MQSLRDPSHGSFGQYLLALPRWQRVAAHVRPHVRRALHPLFRRRVLNLLKSTGDLRSIYFVCSGNLYRSPFAAGCFAAALPAGLSAKIRVASGGFAAVGRRAPPDAVAVAHQYGVDLVPHRTRSITRDLQSDWDVIVAMEPGHTRILRHILRAQPARILLLGDLDPSGDQDRAIKDPQRQPIQVLHESYARIARCADVLADLIVRRELSGVARMLSVSASSR